MVLRWSRVTFRSVARGHLLGRVVDRRPLMPTNTGRQEKYG